MVTITVLDEKTLMDLERGRTYEGHYYQMGHYKIDHIVTTFDCGESYDRVRITTDGHERFLPDIYWEDEDIDGRCGGFKIQTTAYGALEPEDIQKVIAGYQEALEVIQLLEEII